MTDLNYSTESENKQENTFRALRNRGMDWIAFVCKMKQFRISCCLVLWVVKPPKPPENFAKVP